MRDETSCTVVIALALAVGTVGAFGQSLGDVARKEEARRKSTAAQGKVYTNKDLRDVPPASAAPSGPAGSGGAASGKPAATESTPAAGDSKADDAKNDAAKSDASKDKDPKAAGEGAAGGQKDQTYWADRLKQLQTQLDRDQTFLTALEARVAALNTDFVNRDDPAQRATVAKDRQKSLDEMARLTQAIQDDKKAIADFQEEARRAAVPPGWLR